MLRISCLMIALAALFVFSADARAADVDGNVDQAVLAEMGLADLEVMSDTDGEEIRGTFFGFYHFFTPPALPAPTHTGPGFTVFSYGGSWAFAGK